MGLFNAEKAEARRARRTERRDTRYARKQTIREERRGFIEGLAPQILEKFSSKSGVPDINELLEAQEAILPPKQKTQQLDPMTMGLIALAAFMLLKK